MDRRAEDVEAFIRSLREALASASPHGSSSPERASPGSNEAILGLCEKAQLAREFRTADEILGLESVDPARLAALDETIGRALVFVGERGDPRGFTRLADLFVRRGEPRRAILAFERAARDGDADAWERLASLVWDLRDEGHAELALQAIRRAPDGVLGAARYLEGLFAFHGFGRPSDHAKSVALYRRAAALGNPDAMFELYAMLSQGLGAPVDLAEAADFCRRAAEGGNVRAMYNLGAFHATGQNVDLDPERALDWYVRAAEAGHGRAAATAAVMILSGVGAHRGDDVDRVRARELIDLANKNGFDARQLLERSGYAAAVTSTLSNNETQTHQGAARAAEGTKDSSMNTNATVEKVKKVAAKAVKAAKKTTSDAAKALVEAVTPGSAAKSGAKKSAKKTAKPAAKKAAKKPAAKKAAKPAAKKAAKKPAAKKAAKPAAKKPAAKKKAAKKASKK